MLYLFNPCFDPFCKLVASPEPDLVEHLGDQTRLHLVFKDHNLITVTDAHTKLKGGDIVKIRPQNPYYFDADGARVS